MVGAPASKDLRGRVESHMVKRILLLALSSCPDI